MARDIDQWLVELGLSQYSALFAENEVDLEVLPDLTEQDLKDLNIPLGHRKKLLKAIAALSGPASTTADRAVAAAPPATHGEAERRQLTVMFCDLVASTELSRRFDPEEFRDVLRAYHDACAGVIARYDGYVAKYMGDGVLVYFGYPQAHENDAERAARAGLGIVEAVAGLGAADGPQGEVDLAVRIGIATGLVVVGDMTDDGGAEKASVVGETPNLAARLQTLAHANQVVVGELTRQLIGDAMACEDLGAHDLKGIAEPVPAWRVVGERDGDDDDESERERNRAPLLGRHEELGLLLRSWQASKDKRGQVVLIQAEAGIGKSHLVEAFRARLSGEDKAWVSIRCSSYRTNSMLYPVVEHLRRVVGWSAEDGADDKLAKLEAALAGQGAPLEETVPLYAELLSMALPKERYPTLDLSAQEKREQTLDALAAWLLNESERTPLVCVWEDLHWADPTTLALLARCIEQSPTVSMLNVLTYRPDFAPPWTLRSHMTPITLNHLQPTEIEALIERQAGGKTLPPDVIQYIIGKTDGVPLYVEELTKAILEASFLREMEDAYELTGPLSAVSVPATLQDSLMARLDRLPTIREVAQLGSILGREFAYDMLQAIASLDETALHKGLDQLVDAELLYQRGRWPRVKYIFKHALVQDAAYESLLVRTRQYYHRQVAELLERKHPEIVESQPELLAHHYARAGQADKTVEYLSRFADMAAGLYAHAEALAALEEACAHGERLPAEDRDRCVLELVVRQAQSLHFLGRREEIVRLLSAHRGRLERLQEPALSGQYYFWLGFAHAWLGHRDEAAEGLQRGLEDATRAGDEAVMGKIHRALATEYVYSGRTLDDAIAHARQAAALLERTDDRLWLSQALFTLSYCCIFAGDFDSALEAAARLKRFGDTSGLRRAQANAAMLAGLSRATRGEGEAGIALCEQALELSPDDFETAFILACLGRAAWEAGDVARAVTVLEEAVALADEVRSLQFRAWFRTMLGEAYFSSGAMQKAIDVVSKALDVSTETQFILGVGLSKQVLGTVAQAQGDLPASQRHLNDARRIFAELGARFELGRTLLGLATLSHVLGDREDLAAQVKEARSLFAETKAAKYIERTDRLCEQLGAGVSGAPGPP